MGSEIYVLCLFIASIFVAVIVTKNHKIICDATIQKPIKNKKARIFVCGLFYLPKKILSMKINKLEISLLGIGLLYLILLFHCNINETIEGISLLGAEQIIAGKIPYKDFSTIYAPGIFYFNAFLLKIFANSLLVIRIAYLLIAFSISLIIFFLAKNLLSHNLSNNNLPSNHKAFIPFFISIIWQSFIPMNAGSVPIAILLILFATIALFSYYDNLRSNNKLFSKIIPMGISIGLLAVVRQDMASYMYGLFFWAMFWAGIAGVDGLGLSLWKRAVKGFWKGIIFSVIVLLTVTPFALYFISKCGVDILYEQLIFTPLNYYKTYNSLPFPNVFYFFKYFDKSCFTIEYFKNSWLGLIFFIPLLSAVLTIIVLFIKYRKKLIQTNTPVFWKEVLIVNLCLNLFNYAVVRSDAQHLLPSMLFAGMLLSNVFSILNNKIQQFCLSFVILLLIAFPIYSKFELMNKVFVTSNYAMLPTAKGKNIYVEMDFIKYLDERKNLLVELNFTKPIFESSDKSKTIINDDFLFYYLFDTSKTKSSEYYFELYPQP